MSVEKVKISNIATATATATTSTRSSEDREEYNSNTVYDEKNVDPGPFGMDAGGRGDNGDDKEFGMVTASTPLVKKLVR